MRYTVTVQERKEVDITPEHFLRALCNDFKKMKGDFIHDGFWYEDGVYGHAGAVLKLSDATEQDVEIMNAFKTLINFYEE